MHSMAPIPAMAGVKVREADIRSAEYGDHESPIHRACAIHKEKVVRLIRRQVEAAGVPDQQVNDVTGFIAMIKEGAIVTAHVQGDKNSAILAERLALAVLQLHRGQIPRGSPTNA